MLAKGPIRAEALADFDLLAQVVGHKQIFYPAAWAQYGRAIPGSFRLLPPETRLAEFGRDYRSMGVMIFGDPPPFKEILGELEGLESEINGQHASPPAWRRNGEYDTLIAVAIPDCQVSFSDDKGVHNSVVVQASSVLETAGLGVKRVREQEMLDGDEGFGEIKVEISTTTVHTVPIQKLRA